LQPFCDIVASRETDWIEYDIDFDDLQKILYLDIETYIPNTIDTDKVLSKEYGKNYLIPYPKYKLSFI
jgi:hypothetical protein